MYALFFTSKWLTSFLTYSDFFHGIHNINLNCQIVCVFITFYKGCIISYFEKNKNLYDSILKFGFLEKVGFPPFLLQNFRK